MKKILSILILALALSSCNDWLDINPALEIREKEAFATEQGFQDLLIGAYIRMATPSLYGCNTTVRLPEMISQHWTMGQGVTNDLCTALTNFDYTSTVSKTLLETVWLQYYKTITNLNSLLAEIDAKKEIFTDGNYELIKGEAIGLRAFLHFEILRFWSAMPERIKLTDKAIPYVKGVTKDPANLLALSYKQVLDNILAELNQAEALLAEDPILFYTNERLMHPEYMGTNAGTVADYPVNGFHFYRQVRYNYYAVKATKARYYLFVSSIDGMDDQKAQAAKYALEVIDAKNTDGTTKFPLAIEADASNGFLSFPKEHIFAVNNSLATTTLKPVFFTHTSAYTQNKARIATAYEATLHSSDIRYRDNRMWEEKIIPLGSGDFNYFKKFNATETTADEDMPLIRLAEMYFIAIECGHTDLFRTYRIARNMDSSVDGTLTDDNAVKERLELEYRKEFYGEGQMYFFYKRHGYTHFTWPTPKTFELNNLELPIPDSQLLFEN